MDTKEIRELIDLISRSNFASFELEGEGFRLKLVKDTGGVTRPESEVVPSPRRAAEAQEKHEPAEAVDTQAPQAADGLVDLRTPIVGTFYRGATPDAKPFVEVGGRVGKGQVLCIVEAMKVMNEIEAEIEAEVAEILITDGQPVEYGEILFRLRPLG